MESILIGLIVCCLLFFTIRSDIKYYKTIDNLQQKAEQTQPMKIKKNGKKVYKV